MVLTATGHSFLVFILYAGVAEQADATDLKSVEGNFVWVQVPSPVPKF